MRYLLLLLLLSACAESRDEPRSSTSSATGGLLLSNQLLLTSRAFAAERPLPQRFSCLGENASPPLLWEQPPTGTRSLALITDDTDAPGGTFTHWLIYNLPPEIRALPDQLPQTETLSLGALQGLNSFQHTGYDGPCPPPGPPHHYHFRLYALDKMLQIEPGASRTTVEAAMQGHLLAQGELVGTFGR